MNKTTDKTKLLLRPLTLKDKALYESFLPDKYERGCEFSFANLHAWGEHKIGIADGMLVMLSRYGKRNMYRFPMGEGDKKSAILAMMEDAEIRGIDFTVFGMSEKAKNELSEMFPDTFEFSSNEDLFDYVYSISDLADLDGKKYHAKRNHIYRFRDDHPNYKVIPINEENINRVKAMAEKWYSARISENSESDLADEQRALELVLEAYGSLCAEGIMIEDDGEILAFTIGTRLYDDIFDIHFEKAFSDVRGAYTVVNFEFANYLRKKHPYIKYLDREEDMGIEGLRKAKKSYYPVKQIEKYRAEKKK